MGLSGKDGEVFSGKDGEDALRCTDALYLQLATDMPGQRKRIHAARTGTGTGTLFDAATAPCHAQVVLLTGTELLST